MQDHVAPSPAHVLSSRLLLRLALCASLALVGACGGGGGTSGAPSSHTTAGGEPRPSGEETATHAPQTLAEGMTAMGLTEVALEASERRGGSLEGEPVVSGDTVRITESRGYSSTRSVFARQADGTIVMVRPAPHVIVDRRVDGGCLRFAGGRAWFVETTYTLPAGATFGGVVSVPYEAHTEAVDHSPTQADGSPCPPPAID